MSNVYDLPGKARSVRALFAPLFLLLSLVAGCGGSGSQGGGAEVGPEDLAGSITASGAVHLDADTNDPTDDERRDLPRNDSPATAQQLTNPARVAGYLTARPSAAGAGARFAAGLDVEDWYRVTLAEGQNVSMLVADNDPETDFDLALYRPGSPDPVATSLGLNDPGAADGGFESLAAPADGAFLLQVMAVRGEGNYVLDVGNSASPLTRPALRLEADFVPGELVVRFRRPVAQAGTAGERARLYRVDVRNLSALAVSGGAGARLAALSSERLRDKYATILRLKALARDPDVAWVGLNHRLGPLASAGDDPALAGPQYNLDLSRFPGAWERLAAGDEPVVVAVVDTGVVPHPDLDPALTEDGFDFVLAEGGVDDNPRDPDPTRLFHGTHVAGVLGAVTGNGRFIAGAAGPSGLVRIMPVRALGIDGGTEYDVLQAVRYAAGLPNDSGRVPARPADVINLSLGGGAGRFEAAFRAVRDEADVILVAASGNDGTSSVNVPAVYDGVFGVGAVAVGGRRGTVAGESQRAPYSSFGDGLDLMAPGGVAGNGIAGLGRDASGPGVSFYAGTSVATPQVAATAALMKSVWPAMSADDFECALISGALTEDIGPPGWDGETGYGRLDAERAVENARLFSSAPGQLGGQLRVSPRTLDFGALRESLTLVVEGGCPGRDLGSSPELLIEDEQGGSPPWLRARLEEQSAARSSYRLTLDRSSLPEGRTVVRATVRLLLAGETATEVPVLVLVDPMPLAPSDAGTLYVQLRSALTGAIVREQQVLPESGTYRFRFESVPAGRFFVVAGTDRDWDGFINDFGELFGAWPRASGPGVLGAEDRGRGDLDFSLDFQGRLETQSPRRRGMPDADESLRRAP